MVTAACQRPALYLLARSELVSSVLLTALRAECTPSVGGGGCTLRLPQYRHGPGPAISKFLVCDVVRDGKGSATGVQLESKTYGAFGLENHSGAILRARSHCNELTTDQ
jgi:hypothetical protein